jgi:hypothetical protein
MLPFVLTLPVDSDKNRACPTRSGFEMLSSSMYQDLLKHRETLQAAIAADPIYRQLQAVDVLIAIHEGEVDGHSSNRIPHSLFTTLRRKDVKSSPEERDHITRNAVQHQVANRNDPITVRGLVAALKVRGVMVGGKNPGTTLGAILRRRPEFEIVDKELKLWRLKSGFYESEAAANAEKSRDNTLVGVVEHVPDFQDAHSESNGGQAWGGQGIAAL